MFKETNDIITAREMANHGDMDLYNRMFRTPVAIVSENNASEGETLKLVMDDRQVKLVDKNGKNYLSGAVINVSDNTLKRLARKGTEFIVCLCKNNVFRAQLKNLNESRKTLCTDWIVC